MAETQRFAALMAYDGGRYHGWQRQLGRKTVASPIGWQRQEVPMPSVQAAIEDALERVTGTPTRVMGAGRTDTGVHAAGQVIAFSSVWRHGENALLRALNAALPEDIALSAVIEGVDDFHPRYDASSRIYNYSLLLAPTRDPLVRDRAWFLRDTAVGSMFDLSAVSAAAAQLIGEHDFAAFGRPPHGTNSVRTVFRSEWRDGVPDPVTGARIIEYQIEANAFLEHMVRRIVGTLVRVGQGALTVAGFAEVFHSRYAMRVQTRMAPPQGLVLLRVNYPPPVMVKLRHWQMGDTFAQGRPDN